MWRTSISIPYSFIIAHIVSYLECSVQSQMIFKNTIRYMRCYIFKKNKYETYFSLFGVIVKQYWSKLVKGKTLSETKICISHKFRCKRCRLGTTINRKDFSKYRKSSWFSSPTLVRKLNCQSVNENGFPMHEILDIRSIFATVTTSF